MPRWRTARWIAVALALLMATIRPVQAKGDGLQVAVDVRAGHLFVAGATHAVPMVDVAMGRVLRTVAVSDPPFAMAVDARTSRLFVVTTTGPSGSFAVLDTRTGALIRMGPTIQSPQAIAVDEATNRAFIPSSMATVHALNAQTGVVMHVGTTHLAAYTVAIAWRSHHIDEMAHRVVAAAADSSLWLIDTRSGEVVRMLAGAGGSSLAVDEQRGRIFVLALDGVHVLNAATGTPLRTIAVDSA